MESESKSIMICVDPQCWNPTHRDGGIGPTSEIASQREASPMARRGFIGTVVPAESGDREIRGQAPVYTFIYTLIERGITFAPVWGSSGRRQ
jgi:hypothetical protein